MTLPGTSPDRETADALVREGLSRAGFLRLAGAAAVGAVAGPALLGGTASAAGADADAAAAAAGSGLSVLDLHFREVGRVRPFDLIAPRFVEVDLLFGVGTNPSAVAAATADRSAGPALRASAAGGALLLQAADADGGLLRLGGRPVAPFATVIVDVESTPTAGAAVLVGLAGTGTDRVVARFAVGTDAAHGTVTLEVTTGGSTTVLKTVTADLTGPARYAFSVQENYVTALVGRTASWVPVAQVRLLGTPDVPATVDLRDPAVLRQYSYAYGAAGTGSVQVQRIQAGLYGQVGVRDPHVVTYPSGKPFVRGGKLYFTLTNAGLSFFQAAHWAVWRLDLDDPTHLEHVAQLYFNRDGLVLGDHAGQIVVDDTTGTYHLAMSGWGDFAFNGVHARYARTTEDVLSGVHVLASERMALPTTVSSWDPGMVQIRDRWYVSFVESPFQSPSFDFHPALARGPVGGAGPNTGLALVGADTSRHMTEGPVLQRIAGTWYLMASDGVAREYPVYDLRMRLLGRLQAPYGSNIPHPMIVPITRGGVTRYLLLTFDNTQYLEPVLGYGTHGDFIVMQAVETT